MFPDLKMVNDSWSPFEGWRCVQLERNLRGRQVEAEAEACFYYMTGSIHPYLSRYLLLAIEILFGIYI